MDRLSRANAIRAILDSFAPTVSLFFFFFVSFEEGKKKSFYLKEGKRASEKSLPDHI